MNFLNIYFSSIGAVGLSAFALCLLAAIIHSSYVRQFQAIDLSSIAIGFVYGLVMPIVFINPYDVDFVGREYIASSVDIFYVHTFAILLTIVGLYFGWCLPSRKIKFSAANVFGKVSSGSILFWLYMMLFLSVISMYLYTSDYGGFFGYFSYNRLIRSAAMDEFEVSRFSFLLPFGKFAYIAFFGFLGMLLSQFRQLKVYAGFVASLMVSIYMLFANAGRLSAIVFFGIFLLALLPRNLLRSARFWVVGLLPLSIIGSWVMYQISDVFGLNPSENLLSYIVKESSFVFVSFFAQLKNGNLFGLFYDVIVWPAYLLPSSLTINWLTNASEVNTQIIMGAKKGEQGVTGAMPVDMLTFGLMQIHFFGIVVYAIGFGYVLRLLMRIAESFKYSGVADVFSIYVMVNMGVFSIFYSYPKHIIMGYFPIIFTLIVFLIVKKVKVFFVNNRL